MSQKYDIVIIGAGITGSALAFKLTELKPELDICILEQEYAPAMHTSGRNSGVLHPGFHLKKGTLKARLCMRGNQLLREFCKQYGLSHKQIGTLVVAVDESETNMIDKLYEMGMENEVPGLAVLEQHELNRKEPAANGMRALYSPTGTVVNSAAVVRKLIGVAENNGVDIFYSHRVYGIASKGDGYLLMTNNGEFECRKLVNCAGLWADRVAYMMGVGLRYRIFPFRGEYFFLKHDSKVSLNHMIYPVPNLEYPFLGIHYTPTVEGRVILGPNAVLAFGRSSYKFFDYNGFDLHEMISSRHFSRLVSRKYFLKYAIKSALSSVSRRIFANQASRLVNVTPGELERGRPPGNRAQLVDDNGNLVEDMKVLKEGNSIHVLNVVSPGFTCSLAFAEYLISEFLS